MTAPRSARDVLRTLHEERPVVLMGRGHSGTRVLAYAVQSLGVDLGFAMHTGRGDPDDERFRKGLGKAARKWDAPAHPKDRDLRSLKKLFARWRAEHVTGDPWGWKYPESYLLVSQVHRMFPRAMHVHIVRDGRDLAFKHHRTSEPSTTLGNKLLKKIGALDDPPHLRAAKSWAYQVELYRDVAAKMIPREQVLEVTFEGLCANPIEETERIGAFLGLPMDDAARAFMGGFINPKKIAQHRNEDPSKIAEVEAAIGDTLRAFGYETGAPRAGAVSGASA